MPQICEGGSGEGLDNVCLGVAWSGWTGSSVTSVTSYMTLVWSEGLSPVISRSKWIPSFADHHLGLAPPPGALDTADVLWPSVHLLPLCVCAARGRYSVCQSGSVLWIFLTACPVSLTFSPPSWGPVILHLCFIFRSRLLLPLQTTLPSPAFHKNCLPLQSHILCEWHHFPREGFPRRWRYRGGGLLSVVKITQIACGGKLEGVENDHMAHWGLGEVLRVASRWCLGGHTLGSLSAGRR